MKKLFIGLLALVSISAFAEPNFECSIFSPDGATGTLTLFGDSPFEQTYKLQFSEDGRAEVKKFDGNVYLSGPIDFESMEKDVQTMIQNAMRSSRRAYLQTGRMIAFSNTEDPSEATLMFYLMPSGQIAYLEIGFLRMLCM